MEVSIAEQISLSVYTPLYVGFYALEGSICIHISLELILGPEQLVELVD